MQPTAVEIWPAAADAWPFDRNDGFGARELGRVGTIVDEHREELLRAWHDFFSA